MVNNSYHEINKTFYDYAVYLIDNNFLDPSISENYIQKEIELLEAEKQKEIDRELREQQEREMKKLEQDEFNEWLINEIITYSDNEKLELAKEIFLDIIGNYNEEVLKKILVLIDNIDHPLCKDKLKRWLLSHNVASKKVFSHVTGIKLPSTDKGTMSILESITKDKYKGIVPYKKKAKRNEKSKEIFYKLINSPDGAKFESILVEPISKYGMDLFVCKNSNGYYNIGEARSGLYITNGGTKKELMDKLKNVVGNYTIDNLNKIINEAIERNGLSPRYKDGNVNSDTNNNNMNDINNKLMRA